MSSYFSEMFWDIEGPTTSPLSYQYRFFDKSAKNFYPSNTVLKLFHILTSSLSSIINCLKFINVSLWEWWKERNGLSVSNNNRSLGINENIDWNFFVFIIDLLMEK